MSFYLSNSDIHPTGYEPAEFIDLSQRADPIGLGTAAPVAPNLTTEPVAPTRSTSTTGTGSTSTRAYVGRGITVHWDGDRCIHAERCTSGGPAVFDRDARPWVDPDGASPDEIAAVIDTCPSGALSYTRTDGAPNGRRGRRADEDPGRSVAPDPELSFFPQEPNPAEVPVTITPQLDGPLVVEGTTALTHEDGSAELAGRLALCRCGCSGSKPRCDGTHARVGFRAPGVPA